MAFIVVAIGAGCVLLMPAAVGAALALVLVVLLGVPLSQPLARVPENALKFGVGIVLSAFGCFWVAEGLGQSWQGGDAAILILIATFAAVSWGLVAGARRLHARRLRPGGASRPEKADLARAGALAVLAREAWGLFVDDGWLAAGILDVLAGAIAMARATGASGSVAPAALVVALAAVLSASALRHAVQ